MSDRNKKVLLFSLLITLLLVLAYQKTFFYPFTKYDDPEYVVNNPHIKEINIENLKFIFTNQFGSNYHPLHLLSYMIEYKVWKLNPFGYHLTNFLLFLFSSLIIYYSLILLTGSIILPFFVVAIFALHPTHVESVTWIAARNSLLSFFFATISWILFLLFLKSDKKRFYYFSLIAFILGMLSKIVIFCLPVLLLLFLLFYGDQFKIITNNLKNNRWDFIKRIFLILLPFFIIAILLTLPTYFSRSSQSTIKEYPLGSSFYMFLTQIRIFVKYLKILVWPNPLVLMYSVKPSVTLLDRSFIFSFLIIMSLFLGAIIGLVKYKIKLPLFSLVFFFASLIPFSNILPLYILMAERYLLISTIAFATLLVYSVDKLTSNIYPKFIIYIFTILAFGSVVYLRNLDWKDDYTLWSRTVNDSKDNWPAEINLGGALADLGRYDEALEHYKVASKLAPLEINSFLNQLRILLIQERLTEREIHLFLADFEKNKSNASFMDKAGDKFYKNAKFKIAEILYRRAYYLEPNDFDYMLKWTKASIYLKEFDSAQKRINKITAINPLHRDLECVIGMKYYFEGNFIKAEEHIQNEILRHPDNAECKRFLQDEIKSN